MDRREFLAASGAIILSTNAVAAQKQPVLTFSRNGVSLPFYDHEMPGSGWGCPERERIRRIFYDMDENNLKHQKDYDIPCWQWEDDGYRFPIEELNGLLVKPFRWYAWFESDRFHLLQAGIAPGRFEYGNEKVCMFEREVYSGDGQGCSRDKCLLPGPYEMLGKVQYHQAHFQVKCDSYWTTTLPGIGSTVRWRYKVANYTVPERE